MVECDIGITAYNEGENIRYLLESILRQDLSRCAISSIIVVSSKSTDHTNEIVEDLSRRDARIRLILQPERLGKASAVNLFLKHASKNICVLVNSDAVLERSAVDSLLEPFAEPDVGMSGARPIPAPSRSSFMSRITAVLWELHHDISLRSPKRGELIAFRKDIAGRINEDTAVDELCIEYAVKKSGHRVVYAPESRLYIRTPDNVKEFILQRRRIAAGHIWARRVLNYEPSTRKLKLTLQSVFRKLVHDPSRIFFLLAAAALESFSRILGWYDYSISKRNPCIWEICLSTKGRPGYSGCLDHHK